MAVDALIEKLKLLLDLKPLPVEGGWFAQTYRSGELIAADALAQRYPRFARPFGTAIFYLYTSDPDSFSALHWLPTDEIYHFYLGDAVEMLLLYPDGSSQRIILGKDLFNGQKVQFVVPAGVIQGSYMHSGGSYALLGTTMAPAFDETDYHGCARADLLQNYPTQAELIKRLTRPESTLRME